MMAVLVTGAGGFIGSALMRRLSSDRQVEGIAALRTVTKQATSWPQRELGDITLGDFDQDLLCGVDVVVHAAARAHIIRVGRGDSLVAYRQVNVQGTLNLARMAAAAGVRRFIFISSIGVNGNASMRPFTEEDQPNPFCPYALSKWEAEQGLWEIQQETGIELVIIRPPLVYGPNAPGNFSSLLRWVGGGIPLPLGAIHNKRSMVGIDNLIDFIACCITHPAAANQVFLAGDGEDLSTTELLRLIGQAMGRPARLMPVPVGILKFATELLGQKTLARRLLGSLQVDISKGRELLDWEPPVSVKEGLRRCVHDGAFL